ncbi:helix-turn-helix domain containing protein [Paenibacillus sp. TRM 82003]|nr:helix-turn-helix domain containing protein [Paenibacillus sp. TRM 82003]
MHSEVRRFVNAFEEKMKKIGSDRRLNENEIAFLEHVLGPELNFNFAGLTAQLPFKDYKGGNRFVDFYYENGIVRVIFEIDSMKYHVSGITPEQYDDHLERQNDLILNGGWLLLRFSSGMIRKKPMLCRRQLMQAIGKCLIAVQMHRATTPDELWLKRKSEIIDLAAREGRVNVSQVASRFNITRKTAATWLRKMAVGGELTPHRRGNRVMMYLPLSTCLHDRTQ